ncbi:hypothetical protein [Rubrivirga sp.]|uniref:hypothetical protein n=1 Tax=Rubrivirga sp. TaxID=1885344 RepID=UPI003C71058D
MRLAPLLLVAGCAAAPLLVPADLEGTSWVEFCPDPDIRTAFVRFEPGGVLAWSYAHPDSARADTVHSWAVRRDTLFVEWANGTAGTPYRPTSDPAVLEGPATFCPEGATLQRRR